MFSGLNQLLELRHAMTLPQNPVGLFPTNSAMILGNDITAPVAINEFKAKGFENLKGHRTVGGMRASIYNAMPKEGVEKLVEFMSDFEKENK